MRRGLGRGRSLVAIGAVMALVGMVLPWVSTEGIGRPVETKNGFDGAGVLVFVASIGLLALILLPYASSSGRSSLDRPAVYALLAGVAIAGLVIQVVDLWTGAVLTLLPPDRAIGLWLAIIGVALIALGVGDLLGEKPPKPPLRSGR